jgi:hypothetical protein
MRSLYQRNCAKEAKEGFKKLIEWQENRLTENDVVQMAHIILGSDVVIDERLKQKLEKWVLEPSTIVR